MALPNSKFSLLNFREHGVAKHELMQTSMVELKSSQLELLYINKLISFNVVIFKEGALISVLRSLVKISAETNAAKLQYILVLVKHFGLAKKLVKHDCGIGSGNTDIARKSDKMFSSLLVMYIKH